LSLPKEIGAHEKKQILRNSGLCPHESYKEAR
jgi:hypothetical protein